MSTNKGRRPKNGLSFHQGKGYSKDVGKVLEAGSGRVRYKRFWLGHDPEKALKLVKLILAEWKLILAHGGTTWSAAAMERIQRAKQGLPGEKVLTLVPGAPAPSALVQAEAPIPAPPASVPGKMLYTAVDEFVAGFERDARSGQVSDGRWVNASYCLGRLKIALADRTLASIGFNEIRQVVSYFTSRPISASTKRKLAPDTVMDTLAFIRSFFAHQADAGAWTPSAPFRKLFHYNRGKLFTEIELEEREQAKTFRLDELTKLWRACPNTLQQLIFLLGLNCGFSQNEVATLLPHHCHVDREKPIIRRRRHKTGVVGRWRLWPETAELLKKFIAKYSGSGPLLKTQGGQPLVHFSDRYRSDAVRNEWEKILNRANFDPASLVFYHRPRRRPANYVAPIFVRRLGYKHLRKTGGDLIRKIKGREISEVYLAHADPKMSRPYTNRDFAKLSKALRRMRERLEPVLNPYQSSKAAEPVA